MSSITTQTTYQLFVGVAISAATFTASKMRPEAKPGKNQNYQQTLEGFRKLEQDLLQIGVPATQILVVMEATGTYWVNLAVFLHEAGFGVSVIKPQPAHNFAKLPLLRSKSDQLNASALARFAQSHKPATWTLPPQIYHELQQRLNQREALFDLCQQVRNQLPALKQCPVIVTEVQTRLEELISTFDQQIEVVESEISEIVQTDKALDDSINLLKTIPGIPFAG